MAKPQKIKNGDGSTSWRIRYADANGKRVSATFATYDLARSELRRLEVDADETRALRRRDPALAMTVAQAYARFKTADKRAPGVTERRHTRKWRRYEQHYRDHIEPHLGTVLLADLTPSRLKAWIGVLAEKRTGRPGEKAESGNTLSAATIRQVVVTLRQIAKANDVPLMVLVPSSMRQRPRKTRPRAFQSIAEVRTFLMAAEQAPWFRIAGALACHAGLRLGEVASLRWRHIGKDTITVELSWDGPLKARYEDGDDAARVVPLDAELEAILAAWRKLTNGGPDDHVVLVDRKRPLCEATDTDMARRTRRACKRAGVTELTFHELRASYATITADQGLPVTRLSALLGHADVATTAIYIRPESSHAVTDPRARIGGRRMDDGDPESAEWPN